MKGIFLLTFQFVLFGLAFVVYANEECKCSFEVHLIRVRRCEVKLIQGLQNATNVQMQCPNLYSKAEECIKKEVMMPCFGFSEAKTDEEKNIQEKELENFGGKSLYCEYGGIKSISPVIKKISNDENKCADKANEDRVDEYEQMFYSEFKRTKLNSKTLCNLTKEVVERQKKVIFSCKDIFANDSGYSLTDQSRTESNAIAYCPISTRILKIPPSEIDNTHHSTALDFFLPVLIVAILILIGLLIGLCYLAQRKLKKKRVEKEQTKDNEKGKQTNACEREPKPEGEEMVPLSTVVTTENENISSI